LRISVHKRKVVAREEAYLERKFGDVYRTYTSRGSAGGSARA